MADSIAGATDAQLGTMALQMFNVMDANPATYGVTAALTGDLDLLRDQFNTTVADHVAAQANALSKTSAKVSKRSELEALMRQLRAMAKAFGTSDADMALLGIPTPEGGAPPSASVPVPYIDTSERLRHTISWADANTPNNKRKPLGTMGAEIWVKVDGPPPGNESDCTFLTLDAFTPYLAEYAPDDGGKTAHYMLRWRMKDGSVGAFAVTESATITA